MPRKIIHIGGWLLFAAWSAIALIELLTKEDGTTPSIITQIWVNYGLVFAVLILVLRWYLRACGASEAHDRLKSLEEHVQSVERSVEEIKQSINAKNS